MKMKCLKMIVVSLTAAAVCTALTGCGKEEADVSSSLTSAPSVTSSANESTQNEITPTEAEADIVPVPSSDENFKINSAGVLTEYIGSGGDIVVPDGVTSIGHRAFWGKSLTSITLPDSVTSFENQAFYGCEGLTSITIPDSVTAIGEGAFLQSRA